MKSSERNEKIQRLKTLKINQIRVLTNARCLSEGVDVPTLDGVGFIDPKSSQVDIIQAVGRAIRKSENKSCGTIIIPVYLGNLKDVQQEIITSRFKDVWQIILGLKSQDDSLNECIDQLRISIGKRNNLAENHKGLKQINFDLPERISHTFSNSIKTLLVRNTSDNWEERYGELLQFRTDNNHCSPDVRSNLGQWVQTQRQFFKKNKLNKKRIELLEKLRSWVWDEVDQLWEDRYQQTKDYCIHNKHSDLNDRKIPFHVWATHQRKQKREGKLSDLRIKRLESIPYWDWTPKRSKWMKTYKEIESYIEERDGLNSIELMKKTNNTVYDMKIRRLISKRKCDYKDGKLDSEQIYLLESLKGWSWGNSIEEFWEIRRKELKKLVLSKEIKNLKSSNNTVIGRWIGKQRNNYKEGKLSKNQIKLLEEINGWQW